MVSASRRKRLIVRALLNRTVRFGPSASAFDSFLQSAGWSEQQRTRLRWFAPRYLWLVRGRLPPEGKRIYLGDRHHRRCRYCLKPANTLKFKKVAHAFPELIGNKALVDYWECDACNEHFARMAEDDLGKWTQPFRTMGRVSGKGGVPKYKSNDGGMRVEPGGEGNVRIHSRRSDRRTRVDMANRTVTFSLDRQAYVPRGVFKCLVKMALAIAPEEDARLLDPYREWIQLPTHAKTPLLPLGVLLQLVPGPLRNDDISFYLFKRNPSVADCPTYIFSVQFYNLILQIGLPLPEGTARDAQLSLEMAPVPHPWGTVAHESRYGASRYKLVDVSSAELTRGDAQVMTYQFANVVEGPMSGARPDQEAGPAS